MYNLLGMIHLRIISRTKESSNNSSHSDPKDKVNFLFRFAIFLESPPKSSRARSDFGGTLWGNPEGYEKWNPVAHSRFGQYSLPYYRVEINNYVENI
jgi:hypothetical protein